MEQGGRNEHPLRLSNTLTRRKEAFVSETGREVKVFTCGPSVYRRPHVGNYATFLYEDILVRYLKYLGHKVHWVMNITDVEDKAMEEAREQGLDLQALTMPVVKRLFREAEELGISLPEESPRSSEVVDQAVLIIRNLLRTGYAYVHKDDVFFDPLKFPGFGKLYGLDMRNWPKKRIRFRRDTYPGRRWNRGDFILWHGCQDRDGPAFCWSTPLGKGRPAWNVQDPAVITKYLGPRIDIACGGVDNLFRHHDYTIAVTEAFSGEKLARYWLHGEHVLLNGSKMSKSKGNIVYPGDLYREGYTGKQIRFYLIYGHYREKKNLTEKSLGAAVSLLESFRSLANEFVFPDSGAGRSAGAFTSPLVREMVKGFERHMSNDLDVKGSFDSLHKDLVRWKQVKDRGDLSDRDRREVASVLNQADQVFQVL